MTCRTNKPPSYNDILLPLASTMAYVENFLNLIKGYYKVTSSEGDQFEYLVPFPSEYTSTMKAYWTTDVIVLNPSCSWQNATTTGPVNSTWDITLTKSNLSISLGNDRFGMFLLSSNVFMSSLDFSIKPYQYDASFSFRGQKQKFAIHCSCWRFRTFRHRSTWLSRIPWRGHFDSLHGPILHPDTRNPHRKRSCISPVLSPYLYSDPSSLGDWEW